MFNWNKFVCQEKIDGSLIIIYYWNNRWQINTRGSFGDGEVNQLGITWDELIRPLLNESLLNKQYTYVCEFASPYNKIVKLYPEPTLYLLSVFNRYEEIDFSDYIDEGERCGFDLPNVYPVFNQEHLDKLIEKLSNLNKSNEGVVLRDNKNNRIKKKSLSYLRLHRLNNNSDPCHINNIIPLIVNGELEELYLFFPETRSYVEEMIRIIDFEYKMVENLWHCYRDESSQKRFAFAVKDSPHSSILFTARKLNQHPKNLFYSIDYLLRFFKSRGKSASR